jgi:methionyl aminopeptidase
METKIFENYQEAARVHALCRKKARDIIQPGIKIESIADEIESLILREKCGIAFPLNLSVNEVAAHDTATENDTRTVQEGDVIKVDIGVHKEGYITDAAITLSFSKDEQINDLLKVNQEALEAGFAVAEENVEVYKIGKAIEDVMKQANVSPITNLSGHGIEQYVTHCSPTIPNVDNGDASKLEDNNGYAIEPFGSINGNGQISEAPNCEIFEVKQNVPIRQTNSRKLLEFCIENYEGLPFAERWVARDLNMSSFARKIAIKDLVKHNAMEAHNILRERKGAIVSQFETTILINNGAIVRLV